MVYNKYIGIIGGTGTIGSIIVKYLLQLQTHFHVLIGGRRSIKEIIIRKTKCFDFWERNVLFPKTKRSFFRTPKHPLPCPFPLNFSLLIITKKFGNLAKNRYICIV